MHAVQNPNNAALGYPKVSILAAEIVGQLLETRFDRPAVGIKLRNSHRDLAAFFGRLVRMCNSVSPSLLGLSRTIVIRRAVKLSPLSGSVRRIACS